MTKNDDCLDPIQLPSTAFSISQHTLGTIQGHKTRAVSLPQGGSHHKVLLGDGEMVFRTRLLIGCRVYKEPQSTLHTDKRAPMSWHSHAISGVLLSCSVT